MSMSQFVVPYMPSWPILDPEKKCPKGTKRKLHEHLCSLRTTICVLKYVIYKQFTKGQISSVPLSSQNSLFTNYYINQSFKKLIGLLLKTSKGTFYTHKDAAPVRDTEPRISNNDRKQTPDPSLPNLKFRTTWVLWTEQGKGGYI